jgi:hypothetical protein
MLIYHGKNMWITMIFAIFPPVYPTHGYSCPKPAPAHRFLRVQRFGGGESSTLPGMRASPDQPASRLAIIQLAGMDAKKPAAAATTIGTVVS